MDSKSIKVAIIGVGRLGTAVAHTMHGAAKNMRLWSRQPAAAKQLAAALGKSAVARPSIAEAVAGADVTVLAVPLAALRDVARQMSTVVEGDHVVLHAIRGVEPGFVLPHGILRQETCVRRIGVLGGPIYAPRLAGEKVIAAVLASRFAEPWEMAQALTAHSVLRLHRTHDITGVEVASAISNAAALAVGCAQGLDLGDTARGMLLTRGIMEAATVATLCGGEASTLVGLAGVGDLIPRHVATTSRHIEAGVQCALGVLPDAAQLAQLDGLQTARAARVLARQRHVALPLMDAVHDLFTQARDPRAACIALLARDLNPREALAGVYST